jgi:hypothetical protein
MHNMDVGKVQKQVRKIFRLTLHEVLDYASTPYSEVQTSTRGAIIKMNKLIHDCFYDKSASFNLNFSHNDERRDSRYKTRRKAC